MYICITINHGIYYGEITPPPPLLSPSSINLYTRLLGHWFAVGSWVALLLSHQINSFIWMLCTWKREHWHLKWISSCLILSCKRFHPETICLVWTAQLLTLCDTGTEECALPHHCQTPVKNENHSQYQLSIYFIINPSSSAFWTIIQDFIVYLLLQLWGKTLQLSLNSNINSLCFVVNRKLLMGKFHIHKEQIFCLCI